MGGIQGPVAFRRVVVAPNAYKGTLSARAASLAISTGVGRAWPGVACAEVPLADGGDGFLATLVDGREHEIVVLEVSGPLLEPVRAEVGWLSSSDGLTAVLELAGSDGLMLLPRPSPETARRASTRGLGELLRMAGGRQPARILVGLGGSASTDGGAGLAGALGYRLLDRRGVPIPEGGLGLLEIDRIEPPADGPGWSGIEIVAACDVENPLLGPAGAAAVFAPQKGADEGTVALLEQGLARLVEVVARDLGVSGREGEPGMGAAGGAAFGLACFCQAQLTSGVGLVAAVAGLDR
ncbi:MAG TPA: glycerate kinase, partial [Candidatus Dormibacteraeota bacterium]